MRLMKKILLALLSVVLLVSCKTQQQNFGEYNHTETKIDTCYINKLVYDSIYVEHNKDRYTHNDTVYLKENSIEYRYKVKTDTIYKKQIEMKTDSIYIERVIETPRKRNWFDWISYLSFGIIALFLIYKIKNLFYI